MSPHIDQVAGGQARQLFLIDTAVYRRIGFFKVGSQSRANLLDEGPSHARPQRLQRTLQLENLPDAFGVGARPTERQRTAPDLNVD